ncbi:MAG: hypothetical protein ABW321_22935 [Polyangiales bacterium]
MLALVAACDSVLGLGEYAAVGPTPDAGGEPAACESTSECQATRGHGLCLHGSCVLFASPDCQVLTGPTTDPDALVVGTLFSTRGVLSDENRARQHSAQLAVEEINEAGGITAPGDAPARPLVLVGCDASVDHLRATSHLQDLGAVAIVGPDSSQMMLEVATKRTIASGTLLVSPVAIAGSLADLADDDLAWLMAPVPEQRAPLLRAQLGDLSQQLMASRERELRLGVVFREDTFGRAALSTLLDFPLGGSSFAERVANGEGARVEAYTGETEESPARLVDEYLSFAPDGLLLIGFSELVNGFLRPLESRWPGDQPRPVYMLTDGLRSQQLLNLAGAQKDLQARLYGSTVVPTPESLALHESFAASFRAHFPDVQVDVHGIASSYDAVYAIAYAIASLPTDAVSGKRIAQALHQRFTHADDAIAVSASRDGLAAAMRALASGQRVAALGTMGPLHWDDRGVRLGGTIEAFCVGEQQGTAAFQSAGVRLDVATQRLEGTFRNCTSAPASEPALDPAADSGDDRDAGVTSDPAQASDAPPVVGPAMPTPAPGGSAGPAPSPGQPPPPVDAPGTPRCGAATCQADQICCVADMREGNGGPLPHDYQCQQLTAAGACAARVLCSGDLDCPGGTICCGQGADAQCLAQPLCELRLGVHVGCSTRSDCAPGKTCCARRCPPDGAYCELACSDACYPEIDIDRPVCEHDGDCHVSDPQASCQMISAWPHARVCER